MFIAISAPFDMLFRTL